MKTRTVYIVAVAAVGVLAGSFVAIAVLDKQHTSLAAAVSSTTLTLIGSILKLRAQVAWEIDQASSERRFSNATKTRPEVAMRCATDAFGLLERWVPKRISSEELGDALELISRHLENSGSIVVAYFMVVKTIVLILAHVLYERAKVAWLRKGG